MKVIWVVVKANVDVLLERVVDGPSAFLSLKRGGKVDIMG